MDKKTENEYIDDALNMIWRGKSDEKVKQALVSQGLDESSAIIIVTKAHDATKRNIRGANQTTARMMIVGGSIFLLGGFIFVCMGIFMLRISVIAGSIAMIGLGGGLVGRGRKIIGHRKKGADADYIL
jgi:hypothetical protein